MSSRKITAADFPAHHPEWVQRDHMLLAWAMIHNNMVFDVRHSELSLSYESPAFVKVALDPFGLPVLTPELRQRLGNEWRKWKDSQP